MSTNTNVAEGNNEAQPIPEIDRLVLVAMASMRMAYDASVKLLGLTCVRVNRIKNSDLDDDVQLARASEEMERLKDELARCGNALRLLHEQFPHFDKLYGTHHERWWERLDLATGTSLGPAKSVVPQYTGGRFTFHLADRSR